MSVSVDSPWERVIQDSIDTIRPLDLLVLCSLTTESRVGKIVCFWCSLPEEQKEVRQQQEKLVLQEECELITVMEVIKGRLEVTTSHIYFFDCTPNKEEGMRQISITASFEKILRTSARF